MPRRRVPKPKPHVRRHGQGTIYRERDGCYRAQISRRADPKRGSARFDTADAAADWLEREAARLSTGGDFDAERGTVGAWLVRWHALATPSLEPSTATAYKRRLKHFDSIRLIQLAKLRGDHIQTVVAALLRKRVKDGKERPGLTTRTVNAILTPLGRALDDAVRWGLLARSPFAAVDRPKSQPADVVVWDEDEARRFLRVVGGHRFEAAYRLALFCGLRRSELIALRWEDVDWQGSTLSIKLAEKFDRSLSAPKYRRQRVVDVPPSALRCLRASKDAQQPLSLFVFGKPGGKRWAADTLRVELKALCATAKIRKVTLHSLRHCYATLQLNSGMALPDLAAQLGHQSASTTLSTYLHSSRVRQRDAARRLDETLGERVEEQKTVPN